MRIGIDAKWFFNGNVSGKVVVYNLVKNLCLYNTKDEFFIILNNKDRNLAFPFKKNNVTLIYQRVFTNQIANIISPLLLRKYNLDVCVYQYFSPPFAKFKKVAFIHDVIFETSPNYFTFKEKLYFKPIKWFSKLAEGIVTISYNEAKRIELLKYLGKNAKIGIVYNGVDSQFKPLKNHPQSEVLALKAKYNLPKKIILYLGRLNERKNIRILLQSFALLEDKETKLVLAGTYDWRMFNVPELIKTMQIEHRVILTGYVDDKDVAVLYSMASVFCYLSFDEGFGLPPLEAMASGVPIVVSSVKALKEICGDAGFYVNPVNANEIANCLYNVLNDNDYNHNKISIGLERAKEFTWVNSANQLTNFLHSL